MVVYVQVYMIVNYIFYLLILGEILPRHILYRFCVLDLLTLYNNKLDEFIHVFQRLLPSVQKTAKHQYRVSTLHILL